ncbi:unnamed protein product, partial [Protopolystoma xenopodis]
MPPPQAAALLVWTPFRRFLLSSRHEDVANKLVYMWDSPHSTWSFPLRMLGRTIASKRVYIWLFKSHCMPLLFSVDVSIPREIA